MKIIESVDVIAKNAIDSIKSHNKNHFVILIGGCSRSGKTTFSKQLAQITEENGIDTRIICIDSWLLSIEKRKTNSTVYERYDTEGIAKALHDLLINKTIIPPIYDPISRRQINNQNCPNLHIKSGIIIIEGTITLAIDKLVQKSNLNIFIQTSDCIRLKRLLDFYSRVKGLNKKEYKQIISSREKEEIPFIKKSARFADIIFQTT